MEATEVAEPGLVITPLLLTELVPDPRNPRVHDERNIVAIMASLREHGQVEPLVVQAGTLQVIGGNGRLEAMKRLGWQEAACHQVHITDAQARRLSIALNRTGELAEWDSGELAKHLDELAKEDTDFDPDELGFSGKEFDTLIASLAPPPPPPATPGATPPGTQPTTLPSSDARVLQLFLSEETMAEVRLWLARLAEDYETDNLTDTVYQCLRRVARGKGWLESDG